MTTIRVLIADDHQLFRLGLRQACESASDFEVVGEAENGQEAVELAQRCQPDVILMDIQMPFLDGVEATSHIVENDPSTRVIMLTIYRQDRYVFEAIKAGARGYLLKDVDEGELLETIRAVHRGEALINPGLATKVLDEFRRLGQVAAGADDVERLAQGEMDVLCLVAQGASNKEIAARLYLAESTVSNRLSDIYQKLRVNSRTQAALLALRWGWAKLESE
jgi:DNA-binding NarL/FixJ family response regulator